MTASTLPEQGPLVSVIVACYNSARFLRPAIESVLKQTYRNLELILVDDCSTDDTVAIIEGYARDDARVRLVRRETRGGRPAVTKNTGLEHVRGRYLCFLDHDDYYHLDKLATQVRLLEANPDCVAAFHEVQLVDEGGAPLSCYLERFVSEAAAHHTPLEPDVYRCDENFFAFQVVHYAAIHTISVMIAVDRVPRDCLYFDTRYQVCDDNDLWVRLGLEGRMIYVDRILSFYRQHGTNITRNQVKVQEDMLIYMTQAFQRVQPRMGQADQDALKARIAHYYSDLGWLYRGRRETAKSVGAYLKAWQWSPAGAHLVHAAKACFAPRAS